MDIVKKRLVGLIIAAVAFVLGVIGILTGLSLFQVPAIILGLVSYVFIGLDFIKELFGVCMKIVITVAKLGWFIVPFPADIFTGMFTLIMGFMLALVFVGSFVLLAIIPAVIALFKAKSAQ